MTKSVVLGAKYDFRLSKTYWILNTGVILNASPDSKSYLRKALSENYFMNEKFSKPLNGIYKASFTDYGSLDKNPVPIQENWLYPNSYAH